MLTQTETLAIIKEFGKNEQDSGSTAVQIAILTKNMAVVQQHLAIHKKDFSTKRGLMQMVNDRKGLLKYLKKGSEAEYIKVIGLLGIRK